MSGETNPRWRWGPLEIDERRREVFWKGRPLALSPTEFAALAYLARRAGQVVSYEELLQAVWGVSLEQGGSLEQVRSTIKRLRGKLGESPEHPRYLVNVRGVGYRLDLPSEAPDTPPAPIPPKATSAARSLAIAGFAFAIAWLLWGQLPSGDFRASAWYQGRKVAIGLLHLLGRGRFCVASSPDGIYCFDREEERAAATGQVPTGVSSEIVEHLRRTGAVPLLRAEWGDPTQIVWFGPRRVPFGIMWYQTKGRAFCHDGEGSGVLTCFATAEELATAIGLSLPHTEAETIQRLREGKRVNPIRCDVYVVLYEQPDYQGRALALCHDVPDLHDVLFDSLASSLWIPPGQEAIGYAAPGFAGPAQRFSQSLPSLRAVGLDKALRSIRRLPSP